MRMAPCEIWIWALSCEGCEHALQVTTKSENPRMSLSWRRLFFLGALIRFVFVFFHSFSNVQTLLFLQASSKLQSHPRRADVIQIFWALTRRSDTLWSCLVVKNFIEEGNIIRWLDIAFFKLNCWGDFLLWLNADRQKEVCTLNNRGMWALLGQNHAVSWWCRLSSHLSILPPSIPVAKSRYRAIYRRQISEKPMSVIICSYARTMLEPVSLVWK